MAEPKDDPDAPHFVHKMSNHLGNSRLEESLNDFLDLHAEELRLEMCRAGSPLVSGEGRDAEGLKQDKHGQDVSETTDQGEGDQEPGFEDGGFSHRVHSIYEEFLAVVQGNLEEFLEVEGLTEAQLRDACEQEMQAKDPGGLSFMHTLISSWEFSSFIALVSGFLDEGSGSEEEEEEEAEEEQEEAEDADGGGEGGDASISSACSSSHGEKGAESSSVDDRSRRGRCLPRTSGSSSSSSKSTTGTSSCRSSRARTPGSPSPGAAGDVVAADDSFAAAEESQKETPLFATTTTACSRGGLGSVSQVDGGADAAAAAAALAGATGELDGRRENESTRGKRSGAAAPACCRERCGGPDSGGSSGDPPGTEASLLEARGTVVGVKTRRGQRRSVLELPTRAEAKS